MENLSLLFSVELWAHHKEIFLCLMFQHTNKMSIEVKIVYAFIDELEGKTGAQIRLWQTAADLMFSA